MYFTSMVDVEDLDLAALVVDVIPDAIFPAPGTPQAFERCMQRCTDTMWFST